MRVQVINDRGIHICKSMLAWQKYGKDETPESNGLKGDKLVGKYYVEFDKAMKQEVQDRSLRALQKKKRRSRPRSCWKHRKCCANGRGTTPTCVLFWERMNG